MDEKKERRKQYYLDNREKILERNKNITMIILKLERNITGNIGN